MSENVTLDTVKPGEKAKVISVDGERDIKKRITEMGLTRGTVVEVERVAPLGDPLDIKVRGYRLSLRKEEASRVMVEKL
ncbi:MAG: ferrous iron transport protein A [Planctomycetaceae bacterium]|nr:ferrous iron transport protein A [Planctomycetaceae bacterium]